MTSAKRVVQLLLPLRSAPIAKPIISFDCETSGKENRFVLGVVSTPFGERRFTNAQQMLDYLTSKDWRGYHIFATQLSFDAFVLFQATTGDRRMPKGFSAFDNGSKLIWIKKEISDEWERSSNKNKHKEGKRFEFITLADSLNVFPAGVAEMGKILQKVANTYRKHAERTGDTRSRELAERYNVAKLPAPGCECNEETNPDHDDCKSWLGKLTWEQMIPEQRETTFKYCELDAIVTRLFMEWFQREINDLGASLKLTAASTAMDLFRREYMKRENQVIPQPHWTSLIDSRLSYYGGRTEDFVKGTIHDVWDYDVASMYPSSMTEIMFPYPSPEKFVKREEPPMSCLEHEGFSHVTIHVPKMHIPPLPYRDVNKLLFPYGELQGTWTNLELRYALTQGCKITNISWSYFTEKTFNPFTGYVMDLYGKRLSYAYPEDCSTPDCKYHIARKRSAKCSESMATEEVVKLFLNGLYGKFAQNFLSEEEAAALGVKVKKGGGTFKHLEDATEEEIEYTGLNFPEYLADGYAIDKAVPQLKAFMNPILSSYVTARARVKLHEFFMLAQAEGARVLYTDTDSLYVDKPLSFATEEKILGKLQVGKNWERITILGPKSKALVSHDIDPITGKNKQHFTAKGVPGKSFLFTEGLATKRTKPRAELFASLSEQDKPRVTYNRFLRFKEAMARGRLPNEIVQITKTFDPFEFPKRRILEKPTLRDIAKRSFDTEPWEIRDGLVMREREA